MQQKEDAESMPSDIMLTPSKTATLESSPSRATMHRKIAKVKENLPDSPRTFAAVVSNLVDKASPSKKAELQKKGVVRKLGDSLAIISLKKTVKEIKAKRTEKTRQKYNLLAYACLPIWLGINNFIFTWHRDNNPKENEGNKRAQEISCNPDTKKRNDAINAETEQRVKEHWMSESISRIVPHKKRVKKGQPLYVLECSYIQAYRAFKVANPNIKIGYVTFIKLKPSNVRHLKALERSVCCCIKCENMKLKLKVLKQAKCNINTSNLYIDDIHMLSKKTLCPYNDPDCPDKRCVDRACPNCEAAQLVNSYSPILAAEGDSEITYDQWKVIEEIKPMKVKGQKETVKKKFKALRLVTSSISCRELVANLVKDAGPFSAHLFRARWQADQFRRSKLNMPPKSAVLVADNYACSMNDEVQSYHWGQAQVTIHPVMAYINNSDQTSAEPTHTDSIFCITDDPKHDAAAVHRCMQETNTHLTEKYNISSKVLFSDCCAAQYRGKTSFADMSFAQRKSGISLSRHFYESSHGKSAADGLNATVKHAATQAVTRGQVIIRNAKEFDSFCKRDLQNVGKSVYASRAESYKDASRHFILVDPESINRDGKDRDVKQVAGTMKIHSVLPTNVPYEIKTRELSCFCDYCQHGHGSRCSNKAVVGEWDVCHLKSNKQQCSTNILLLTLIV